MSTHTGEASVDLREVLSIGLPAVAYQPGGTLLLLRLGTKGSSQRVYDGKMSGRYRTVTLGERTEL